MHLVLIWQPAGTNLSSLTCFVLLSIVKILAKVFSREALESYLPRLQDLIKSEVAKWCLEPGAVDVYSSAKSLTFRIAISVLLNLQLEEERILYLAEIFEQLMNNLFSLPIDAPLSGLRKVQKVLHIILQWQSHHVKKTKYNGNNKNY